MEKAANNPEYLERIYKINIQSYERKLSLANQGKRGFRKGEIIQLIALWNEVKDKKFIYADLSANAIAEVDDAIFDELDTPSWELDG